MSHLKLEQRYTIETLLQEKYSLKDIAKHLKVCKSVITRELQRNSDQRSGVYKAKLAQSKYEARMDKKSPKTRLTEEVKSYIKSKLGKKFSPEQIYNTAKRDGVDCVSHETIYKYIWEDKKKDGDLYKKLRNQGKKYRKRGAKKDKRGQIVGKVNIKERDPIVEERSRLGDLEMDLIIGKDHKGALLTINDRATGKLYMRKIKSKEAKEIEENCVYLLQNVPNLHTLTSDNGKEFANHVSIAKALELNYYFADPYKSWQRGSNENLNGLIRQYFPKNHDFRVITDAEVKFVVDELNNRPRKRFGYLTPNEVELKLLNNMCQVAFTT
jgi:IS30 family transposase